jgi:hypothetical protein
VALRLPGQRRRRRRWRVERGTVALGVVASGLTLVVLIGELARVWRRGSAPLPSQTDHVFGAGAEAVRETVAVARAGYQGATPREHAALNMLGSFTLSFASVRLSTHLIRRGGGRWGPFFNVRVGGSHVHHFVPGIAVGLLAGGAGLLTTSKRAHAILAVPYGTGLALTLDESALLLNLDDVYWSEEGVVSVQITFAALAILAALTLILKILRRGEHEVLELAVVTPAANGAQPHLPPQVGGRLGGLDAPGRDG